MKEGVLIKKSRNGKGVFSNMIFKKGETVFEIKGKLMTCYVDDDIDEKVRDNTFRFNSNMYLNPEGHISVFVNHSCCPNSKIVKKKNKLYLVSISGINKGEEIVFDYSTTLASDDIWEMKCNCGNKECRGIVKNFDSMTKSKKDYYVAQKIVPAYILRI